MTKIYESLDGKIEVYEKMSGVLRPRQYLKFPLVKATVKEIAHKSFKETKPADVVAKS